MKQRRKSNEVTYDWVKTMSFDADITIVAGGRDIGKTFGWRGAVFNDFVKRGKTFVDVSRFDKAVPSVMSGYFDKLLDKNYLGIRDYEFRNVKRTIECRKRSSMKKNPNEWRTFGYFVSLPMFQDIKRGTFTRVRKIGMDEAIIDKELDAVHDYWPNEWRLLQNVVDSCSRERGDERQGDKPRVYLMGNAVDLMNPYFVACGIRAVPPFGYSWYRNKTVLLDYIDSDTYKGFKEMRVNTVAGRMMQGTGDAERLIENKFDAGNDDYIARKTPSAKCRHRFLYNGKMIGVWLDMREGYWFISWKWSDDRSVSTYYITDRDRTVNYLNARLARPLLKELRKCDDLGIVRYSDPGIMAQFREMLRMVQ